MYVFTFEIFSEANMFVCFIGIDADLYTPPENTFQTVDVEPENKCFCPGNEYCPPKGLQNISPCQYGKFIYSIKLHH